MDLESSLRLITLGQHSHVILQPSGIQKIAEGLSMKCDGRLRKKFLADCSHIGSLTYPRVLKVLKTFSEYTDLSNVIGYRKFGHTVHFIQDFPRMRHVLGLSDAVDQAMLNFRIRIRFPCQQTCAVSSPDAAPRGRVFSKRDRKGNIHYRVARPTSTANRRRFDLVLHYLRVLPKGLPEKEYVSRIKLSLAGMFSLQAEQELPRGYYEKSFPLFPAFTQKKLDNILKHPRARSKRISFYFNLLQSKALCASVGEDMIEEAYEKHHASICRPLNKTIPKDDVLYSQLFDHAKTFFSECCTYDPYKTSIPNGRSSIEKGRPEGGNRAALLQSGSLQRISGHPILGFMDDVENPRMEPYVVGLFGDPGSGKSTTLQRLISLLKSHIAPDMPRSDFVYSRSCNTDHWDGYTGQIVTVLDDFGQDRDDRSDIAEFMTLISVNDYVLPMADLRDKGQKFRSAIVIVTSNMGFGAYSTPSPSGGFALEDDRALWRRFDLPILVSRVSRHECELLPYSLYPRPSSEKKHGVKASWVSDLPSKEGLSFADGFPGRSILPKIPSIPTLASRILQDARDKLDFHKRTLCDSWTQYVSSYRMSFEKPDDGPLWQPTIVDVDPTINLDGDTTLLDFSANPPAERPVVRAHALPEPLKVRMITVGEADTKVLQPLQRSLWSGLGKRPQFCLTNGVKDLEDFDLETLPWVERIEAKIKEIRKNGTYRFRDPVWLSGDYTAATDNFPMWATEALLEGILSQISHEPTKAWARWEISSHEIRYPGKVGYQTSGQLMGSLLSFPLLCLLNDFVMQQSGLSPDTYMVNGDDVVACCDRDSIETWKNLAPRVGLSLSVGKNFVDEYFCTVNSQLFYKSELIHTGKCALSQRAGTTIDYCFAEAQYYWGATPELAANFLQRNWVELSKTPRSLHFSKEHGGLGRIDCRSSFGLNLDQNLAKRVYLYDTISRFGRVYRIRGAPFSVVTLPLLEGESIDLLRKGPDPSIYSLQKLRSLMALSGENPDEDKFSDLSHLELRRFVEAYKASASPPSLSLFNSVLNEGRFDLEDAPSSDCLGVQYVAITNGLARRYAEQSVQVALRFLVHLWLDPASLHPYEIHTLEDGQEDSFAELLQSFDFYSNPMVRLFQGGDLASIQAEAPPDCRKDVLEHWARYEPGRLGSFVGGELFVPPKRNTELLDEFLSGHLEVWGGFD